MSYIPFVTSSHSFQLFMSFQLFVSVHCVFPSVSPFPYYAMRYFCPLMSARFKFYIPFVSSSLSFQLFPAVCSVLPSDLILPVSSQLFLSVRCVLSFISSLLFHLLLPFFPINSYVLFVSFLSHKLLCPDRSVFPSVSNLPFYSLRLCLRINSSVLLVWLFLSFHLVHFVASILSFQLFPPMCYFFPFVSTLTSRFTENLKKMQFARKATCGHLRPLEWLQVAANNANGCKCCCSGNFKSYQ